MSSTLRLAVDVGGTFTDLVLHDGATGAIATGKLLTTPADPSIAIIEGTRRLLQKHGKSPADLDLFIHATTLVTNTLIERKGAVDGPHHDARLSRHHRDGHGKRATTSTIWASTCPPPLVPRAMRREVAERMDAAGAVLTPLDLAESGVPWWPHWSATAPPRSPCACCIPILIRAPRAGDRRT